MLDVEALGSGALIYSLVNRTQGFRCLAVFQQPEVATGSFRTHLEFGCGDEGHL